MKKSNAPNRDRLSIEPPASQDRGNVLRWALVIAMGWITFFGLGMAEAQQAAHRPQQPPPQRRTADYPVIPFDQPVRRANYVQPSEAPATGKNHVIRRFELKQTSAIDAARLISELSGLNIVATEEAAKKQLTLYLQNVRAIDAIETMSKVGGLWYREDEETGTIRLMTAEEYQRDLVVFRNDITKVFTLLHPNATSIAIAIQSLYQGRVVLSLGVVNDDQLVFGGSSGGGFGGGFGGGLGGSGFGGVGGFGTSGTGGVGGFGGGFSGVGGAGGFGGVGLGLGSPFGGGQFSRQTGGGFFAGGFGGTGGIGGFGGGFGNQFGIGLRERDLLLSEQEPLTPEQISTLEGRLRALEGRATNGVASEVVREITQREPPIYVTTNSQHNLVVVRTSDADAMKAIERLVFEIDRPTPEVLLELRILEVTVDDNFHSIFDLQFNNGPQGPSAANQVTRNPFILNPATAAESVLGAVNVPVQGGSLVYQFLNNSIRARVELLEQEGRIDTISTPLLLASNNRPSRIFVGEERVLTTGVTTAVVNTGVGTASTVVTPTTEIRDIGMTLILIPKINADRTVTMFISQDNSTVNTDAADIPVPTEGGGVIAFPIDTVSTANIQGTVVAKDGLTVAIGGLVRETVNTQIKRVPILGRLPHIGFLFRQEIDQDQKRELVLLITPHVITTPAEGEMKTRWRVQELSDHSFAHPSTAPLYDAENQAIELPGSAAPPFESVPYETIPRDTTAPLRP